MIHMKYQVLLSLKNKNNISESSLLQFSLDIQHLIKVTNFAKGDNLIFFAKLLTSLLYFGHLSFFLPVYSWYLQ